MRSVVLLVVLAVAMGFGGASAGAAATPFTSPAVLAERAGLPEVAATAAGEAFVVYVGTPSRIPDAPDTDREGVFVRRQGAPGAPWDPEVQLESQRAPGSSHLAVAANARGDVAVVWVTLEYGCSDPQTTPPQWCRRLGPPKIAVRPAGGVFGPAETLPRVGPARIDDLAVSVDRAGAATVVSRETFGVPDAGETRQRMVAATRAPDGSFSTPQVLADARTWPAGDPTPGRPYIAHDAGGNAAVAFAQGFAGAWRTMVRERPAGAPAFSAARDLGPFSASNGWSHLALAGGADGIVAAWQSAQPEGGDRWRPADMVASVRPPGGTFGEGRSLGVAYDGRASAAVNASGDVSVSWADLRRGITSVLRPAGGSFATLPGPAPGTEIDNYVSVSTGLDRFGTTTVVGTVGRSGEERLVAYLRARSGAPEGPFAVSGPGARALYPAMATDAEGNGVIAWQAHRDVDDAVLVSTYRASPPRPQPRADAGAVTPPPGATPVTTDGPLSHGLESAARARQRRTVTAGELLKRGVGTVVDGVVGMTATVWVRVETRGGKVRTLAGDSVIALRGGRVVSDARRGSGRGARTSRAVRKGAMAKRRLVLLGAGGHTFTADGPVLVRAPLRGNARRLMRALRTAGHLARARHRRAPRIVLVVTTVTRSGSALASRSTRTLTVKP